MQTYTGKQFFPLDPRIEDIDIVDIAAGLSAMCRYNGQCTRFYSVAEHATLLFRRAPDHFKRAALLHDASEAYITDSITPVKRELTNYYQIENRLMRAIAQRYHFDRSSSHPRQAYFAGRDRAKHGASAGTVASCDHVPRARRHVGILGS